MFNNKRLKKKTQKSSSKIKLKQKRRTKSYNPNKNKSFKKLNNKINKLNLKKNQFPRLKTKLMKMLKKKFMSQLPNKNPKNIKTQFKILINKNQMKYNMKKIPNKYYKFIYYLLNFDKVSFKGKFT